MGVRLVMMEKSAGCAEEVGNEAEGEGKLWKRKQ